MALGCGSGLFLFFSLDRGLSSRFVLEVDAAEGTQDYAGQYHAYYGEGIGHSVAVGETVGDIGLPEVAHCLLGGGETRGVGDGAGVDASHVEEAFASQFGNDDGDDDTEGHIGESHQVEG